MWLNGGRLKDGGLEDQHSMEVRAVSYELSAITCQLSEKGAFTG